MKRISLLILVSLLLVGCQSKIELVDNPVKVESVYYKEEEKYYDAIRYNDKVYHLYGKASEKKDFGTCIGYLENIHDANDKSKYVCLVNNYKYLLFLYNSKEDTINVYLDITSGISTVPDYVTVTK